MPGGPVTPPATLSLDQEAKNLYDACQTVKPAWHDLGDVTKDVWRERVQGMRGQQASGELIGDPAAPMSEPRPPAGQFDLFA